MKNNLTKISDLTPESASSIIDTAFNFKELHQLRIRKQDLLRGSVVALVFEKPSLRTKVAFEVATSFLGGTPVYLSSSQILQSGQNQSGRESIPDIGRNLERFCDLIVARVYKHDVIEQLATSVKIPVVNALCDLHHPTQALADIMTIKLHKGEIDKNKQNRIKVCYVGDGNNVATSLMQACMLFGYDFAIATPSGYEIPIAEIEVGKSMAKISGAKLYITNNIDEAVCDADVLYTDTFVSMGQEAETKERLVKFADYQVNMQMLKKAKSDVIFMHCLPAHRGEEVTDEVMDSKASVIFDQAECRLHIAKALIKTLLVV